MPMHAFNEGYAAGWRSIRGASDRVPSCADFKMAAGAKPYQAGFARGIHDAMRHVPASADAPAAMVDRWLDLALRRSWR